MNAFELCMTIVDQMNKAVGSNWSLQEQEKYRQVIRGIVEATLKTQYELGRVKGMDIMIAHASVVKGE